MNKVLIGFLGNINYDTRCKNFYESFEKLNYEVSFIGFDFLTKGFIPINGKISVYKLEKKNSLLFYLRFYFKLFVETLKKDFSICFAEDVFVLPVFYIVAKIKKAKVFYDSRELFGFLASLKERKITQFLIYRLERCFIRKVDGVIVTGGLDAEFIRTHYKINNVFVLRNLPFIKKTFNKYNLRKKFNIPEENLLLIYQGVVVKGRGLKLAFEALVETKKTSLVILGDGEYKDHYENLVDEYCIREKVFFAGKVSQDDLLNYTASADLGICLIENLSLSYYYALPNKLFEYIMAEIPVIISDLPQMVKITDDYKVGYVIERNEVKTLLLLLQFLEDNKLPLSILKQNCINAKMDLNWDKEFEIIKKIISPEFC